MKSFVRLGATLGLVGSTLLGSSFLGNLEALALPAEQVIQKLQTIPVFTVTDAKGSPLVRSIKNAQNKDVSVAGIFISQGDAQGFVEQLKKNNPALGKSVQVSPVSLGEVYKLGQANQNKPDGLNFAFVPKQQQVQFAVNLLRKSGQQVDKFDGVPLFVAKAGKDKGYLTVQQGNQQVIPFFFEQEQLQGMVARFKNQKPELASTVEVQVVNLQGLIQALRDSNKPEINSIVLVPANESMQFLQKASSAPRQAPAPVKPPQNRRR